MNQKLFICIILSAMAALPVFSQQADKTCRQTPEIFSMLNKFHYQPIPLNDKTSEEIFNSFIEKLDPYTIIFTDSEIHKLSVYKTEIENFTAEQSCAFLKLTADLYHAKLIQADTLTATILSKPFDFSNRDTLFFSDDYTANFPVDDKELEKRWRKYLKYEALSMLFVPSDSSDKPLLSDPKKLLLKESEARKKLLVKEKRFFKMIMENPIGYENYVCDLFYNSIANRYDPHTDYFSPVEKEKFQASLSKEAKSFGISIENGNNGEVEINYLNPGGPAWKSNQVHKGDVLLKIKWPGKESIDLSYSDAEEVERLISSSASDKLDLTIRTTGGMVKTIPLVKEKISVDENTITGFILNGDKKIGYISLPGFYTEWGNKMALGCANDLAKEILKLQKENIEGLLLDLRNNGGGSVYEAINLAGIFIDEGPLFMHREKNGKPILLKDINRGTIYNGPLLIMVNGFSASASELFSASMQDYNRALIVGSTTYGKAIGQSTLPLDTTIALDKSDKIKEKENAAYLNITLNKFYRINGGSYQKTGVRPDVELPDFFSSKKYGEAANLYAITSDSVSKKVYYTALAELPKKQLSENSKKRIEQKESNFRKIKTVSDSMLMNAKQTKKVPLNIESFKKYQAKQYHIEEEIKKSVIRSSSIYTVSSTKYDEGVIRADKNRKEMNDVLLKNIQEDIYIEESLLIMNDFINFTKK